MHRPRRASGCRRGGGEARGHEEGLRREGRGGALRVGGRSKRGEGRRAETGLVKELRGHAHHVAVDLERGEEQLGASGDGERAEVVRAGE